MFREIVTETLGGWGLPAAPEALDRLERYCALLLQKNEVMNLTAARTPEEVARRHISDSLFLLKCTELTYKSILDLGTGAGFPGLPLKLYDPALDVTLLDSRGKRIDFIREVLDDLGLQAPTYAARAEDAAQELRGRFDVVTSRAVAPLNVLSELSVPFLRKGGLFLPMKSRNEASAQELADAGSALRTLGCTFIRSEAYELDGPRQVLVIEKTAETPKKYPRKYAQIAKKPL